MLLIACGRSGAPDAAPASTPAVSRGALVSDQVHGGGIEGFFWLPPLVPETAYGTFRAGLAPDVVIERLPLGSAAPVARFTTAGGEVRSDGVSQHHVNWDTKASDLDPAATYRIRVLVGAVEIGFADVDVVSSGSELRNVATSDFIPLLDGRTLPIKFRTDTSLDLDPPTAPTDVVVAVVSATRLDVSWAASSDNVGVTEYRVSRDGAPAAATSGTAFSDDGLGPATRHCYTVVARDRTGNVSAASAPGCAETLPLPPDAPTALTVTDVTAGGALLGWVDASANETGFEVGWCTGATSEPVPGALVCESGFEKLADLPADAASFGLTGLAPASTYVVYVRAVNAGGSSDAPAAAFRTACEAPTLARCQDAAWVASACGAESTAACKELGQAELARYIAALPSALVPLADLAGETTDGKLVRYDRRSMQVGGMTRTYEGRVQRAQLEAADATADAPTAAEESGWLATPGVSSCAEYAFERFQALSEFQRRAYARVGDWRAIVTLATTELRELQQWVDAGITEISWPAGGFKNAFARGYAELAGTGFQLGDQDLADRLAAARGTKYRRHDLAWHFAKATAIDALGVPDSRLEHLQLLQLRFTRAVAERQRLLERGADSATLASADERLRRMLAGADARGCVPPLAELKEPTDTARACDWSPGLFWAELRQGFTHLREREYQRCMRLTGDDFALARNADVLGGDPPLGDATVSAAQFRMFLARYAHVLSGKEWPPDPLTGRPKLAWAFDEHGDPGSEYFGAVWAADGSWSVDNFTGSAQVCDARIAGTSGLWLDGEIATSTFEILDARLTFEAGSGGASSQTSLAILGTDVAGFTDGDSARGATPIAFTRTDMRFASTPSVELPVVSFYGLSVVLKGGISGAALAAATSDLHGGTGCGAANGAELARARMRFSPILLTGAYAAVALDALVAEAGVKGDVTLMDALNPYDVDLGLTMSKAADGTLQDVSATIAGSYMPTIRVLDGSLSVYADTLFTPSVEYEFFSWDGYALGEQDSSGSPTGEPALSTDLANRSLRAARFALEAP